MIQLSELYSKLLIEASNIPGFVKGGKEDVPYDIDVLANAYCKAVDEFDEAGKNHYLCAWMIRYWHMILYYVNKSPNIPTETIIDWIVDGFLRACKYRSWMKDPKLIGNRRGAELVINQCITTVRANFYAKSNAQKRAEFFFDANLVRLDSLEEHEYDSISQVTEESYPVDLEVVNRLLDSDRYLDGVVVDLIINGSSAIDGKYSHYVLAREIRSLGSNYYEYFTSKYRVKDPRTLKDETSNLSKVRLRKSFERLRNTPFIKALGDGIHAGSQQQAQ